MDLLFKRVTVLIAFLKNGYIPKFRKNMFFILQCLVNIKVLKGEA